MPSLESLVNRINLRLEELVPYSSTPLFAAARYSLLSPGKRLRPGLVLATAAAFGADLEIALDPACALEMVHTYSLIHDDLPCMDDDNLRRGRPTLHKIFPEGIALLVGDYLLTYAFEVIGNAPNLTSEERLRLVQILATAAGSDGMIGGQASDITSSGTEIEEEALLKMHRDKTGALLAAALQFGAVIGNAPESQFAPLKSLAFEIGLAFQFLDDLLDATSSREVLGKEIKRDAALKKPTAVAFYGVEGVEKKLQEFEASIHARLLELPQGAPLIADFLCQHLWARIPTVSH
jgi:geranylgeranyl diphosphate synthase, type II